MTSPARPLRIGVLGAANIARQFISGVAPSKLVKVTTIASRDVRKAQAFAKETGVERSLGSYEAMLADKDIDAIYNPLPNSMHAEWTIAAARAGKHILCEKPLAVTGAEARAMFAAAREAGVRLVEAYPYRPQAQTRKMAELIASGAIGKVQFIQASFAVVFTDPTNIRLIPSLGGGALMDAGSYVVSYARLAAGARPTRVNAVAVWDKSGVDRTISATLEHGNGVLAQLTASFSGAYHRRGAVIGDEGIIEAHFWNHPPIGGPPVVRLQRGNKIGAPVEDITVPGGNGFLLETEEFARLVSEGPKAWNGASEEESIDIADTLEAILKSARAGKPVALTKR